MTSSGTKRLAVISDLHCGAQTGLTPPAFYTPHKQSFEVVSSTWSFFESVMASLGELDILVLNGDAVDGKGKRSGGVELIETDMDRQADIAIAILETLKFDRLVVIRGTPYHVSNEGTNVEKKIADHFKADYGGHLWLDVNGHIFDFKHKVSGSGVPTGVPPLRKEWVWNALWAERNVNPRADTLIRSHVHRFDFAGNGRHLSLTTPCLQAPGSIYGVDQCSGTVDYGLIHFDIDKNGRRKDWRWHLLEVVDKQEPIRC